MRVEWIASTHPAIQEGSTRPYYLDLDRQTHWPLSSMGSFCYFPI